MNTKNEIRQKLTDPLQVLTALNLMDGAKKTSEGIKIPCPWHADSDPSCHVRPHRNDGTLSCKCFGCGKSADVFSLIGQAHGITNFVEILKIASQISGVEYKDDKNKDNNFLPSVAAEFVPSSDLQDVWKNADSPNSDIQVKDWFIRRQLDPCSSLCRILTHMTPVYKWMGYTTKQDEFKSWHRTGNRLIFPLYDSAGTAKGFKARNIYDNNAIKSMNPTAGYTVTALCLANTYGRKCLAGEATAEQVVFVEGESDFLAINKINDMDNVCIFGVYSGSWSEQHFLNLGNQIEMTFLTDRDEAGHAYKMRLAKMFFSCWGVEL
jgi:DNA primase